MGNYLRRVATAAARTRPSGTPAVGMPTRLPEILFSPIGRPTPGSLSDGRPLPVEIEKEITPSLILPGNAVSGIVPSLREPYDGETIGGPQASPESDDSPILHPAVGPDLTVPRYPPEMPPLTGPSGAPLSPSKPSPESDQTASEFRLKSSVAPHPSAARGINAKKNASAAVAPMDQPGFSGQSEAGGPISPPRHPGPPKPFRVQALASNPSHLDARILRRFAQKDVGTAEPIAPSPVVPTTVELSPSGGLQGRTSIRHAEADPLPPSTTPSGRQGQERPDPARLNSNSAPEAVLPPFGRGGGAIALPQVADRLNWQKNAARIAIGRIEVQVNNHPLPVAAAKIHSTARLT